MRSLAKHPDIMLLQSGIALVLLAVLLLSQKEILAEIYWGPLATDLGMIVNGVIVLMFLVALARIFYLLPVYIRENKAIEQFSEQLDAGLAEAGIEHLEGSLVVQRYRVLQQSQLDLEPVQQSSLSALLLNQEAMRLGLVRLVQALLILLGVFGTVAALSLALIGASDLFSFPESASGITAVMRGMATALSTTMTAIAAYLVLTFLFSRLMVSQSSVCQQIEFLTLRRLTPMVSRTSSNLSTNLAMMLKDLNQLAEVLRIEAVKNQGRVRDDKGEQLIEELQRVSRILQQGFRLDRIDR